MTQYISKDALVAEIEKCYNECLKRAKITDSGYWDAKADAYRNVLVILNDSLEVKEVDLKEELDEWIKYGPHTNYPWCTIPDAIKITAEHFLELGLKAAQKGE